MNYPIYKEKLQTSTYLIPSQKMSQKLPENVIEKALLANSSEITSY